MCMLHSVRRLCHTRTFLYITWTILDTTLCVGIWNSEKLQYSLVPINPITWPCKIFRKNFFPKFYLPTSFFRFSPSLCVDWQFWASTSKTVKWGRQKREGENTRLGMHRSKISTSEKSRWKLTRISHSSLKCWYKQFESLPLFPSWSRTKAGIIARFTTTCAHACRTQLLFVVLARIFDGVGLSQERRKRKGEHQHQWKPCGHTRICSTVGKRGALCKIVWIWATNWAHTYRTERVWDIHPSVHSVARYSRFARLPPLLLPSLCFRTQNGECLSIGVKGIRERRTAVVALWNSPEQEVSSAQRV